MYVYKDFRIGDIVYYYGNSLTEATGHRCKIKQIELVRGKHMVYADCKPPIPRGNNSFTIGLGAPYESWSKTQKVSWEL